MIADAVGMYATFQITAKDVLCPCARLVGLGPTQLQCRRPAQKKRALSACFWFFWCVRSLREATVLKRIKAIES
jgi:hypothetical protein